MAEWHKLWTQGRGTSQGPKGPAGTTWADTLVVGAQPAAVSQEKVSIAQAFGAGLGVPPAPGPLRMWLHNREAIQSLHILIFKLLRVRRHQNCRARGLGDRRAPYPSDLKGHGESKGTHDTWRSKEQKLPTFYEFA